MLLRQGRQVLELRSAVLALGKGLEELLQGDQTRIALVNKAEEHFRLLGDESLAQSQALAYEELLLYEDGVLVGKELDLQLLIVLELS